MKRLNIDILKQAGMSDLEIKTLLQSRKTPEERIKDGTYTSSDLMAVAGTKGLRGN